MAGRLREDARRHGPRRRPWDPRRRSAAPRSATGRWPRRTSRRAPASPTSVQPSSRGWPSRVAAWRMATISAWAVGSRLPRIALRASAMISSPSVMTAPTGTSPASAATAARSSARRIGGGSGKAMAGRALAATGRACHARQARQAACQLAVSCWASCGRRTSTLGTSTCAWSALHLDLRDRDIGLAACRPRPSRSAPRTPASGRPGRESRRRLPRPCGARAPRVWRDVDDSRWRMAAISATTARIRISRMARIRVSPQLIDRTGQRATSDGGCCADRAARLTDAPAPSIGRRFPGAYALTSD